MGSPPDGEAETMRYSTNGFTRFDPFFYVSYDDEFFYKSHNAVAVESSVQRGPILARYSPLALLVKDVWAHHPPPNYPPHGALPSCYHEDKSGYLSRFMFTDDHEGTSSPEMEIRVNASFRVMSSAWNNHKVPRGFWDYRKADHKNTWYPPYDGLYPEMWRHPGYNCVGDVFDASIATTVSMWHACGIRSSSFLYDTSDNICMISLWHMTRACMLITSYVYSSMYVQ